MEHPSLSVCLLVTSLMLLQRQQNIMDKQVWPGPLPPTQLWRHQGGENFREALSMHS